MSLDIENYYAAVDGGDLDAAVAMLSEDVEFAMILPTGVNRGRGRDSMLGYLRGRPPVDRKHRIRSAAVDGAVQFAHGAVTENGIKTTGYFVGVMHVDAAGLIDRYQVSFDTEFSVQPLDLTTEGVHV